ncbi:LAGLIDADG family homing endonuclease [Bacteroidota bacterium]
MIGDGHIGIKIRPKRAVDYIIVCSGNSVSDKNYVSRYVKRLKKLLYNLDFMCSQIGKNKSEIRLKINSKALVGFYSDIIGLPVNKKKNIGIPNLIWTNKKFLKACLRGIVDTDFSFVIRKNGYPVLKLKTESRKLVMHCQKAFRQIGIESSINLDAREVHSKTKEPFFTNYLYISGKKKVKKYVEVIGFRNERNLAKLKKLYEPTGNFVNI